MHSLAKRKLEENYPENTYLHILAKYLCYVVIFYLADSFSKEYRKMGSIQVAIQRIQCSCSHFGEIVIFEIKVNCLHQLQILRIVTVITQNSLQKFCVGRRILNNYVFRVTCNLDKNRL